MRIGLRVCVNSLRGARQGVPNLLRLFDTYKVCASFFFALGPDRCGRFTTAHGLQPWCKQRDFASRLAATLLPPPIMVNRIADQIRLVKEAGHEVGLLSFDPVHWINKAAFADENWTRQQLLRAVDCFERVMGTPPRCHAAPGWQVNPHLIRMEQELGFDYASDVRGKTVFLPRFQEVDSTCPQIPTTLPTLWDLLTAQKEVTAENVHEYLYADSQYIVPHGHVFSLDAELEGAAYLSQLEKLLVMWKGYGEGLKPLGDLLGSLDKSQLKTHQVGWSAEGVEACYLARQALPT